MSLTELERFIANLKSDGGLRFDAERNHTRWDRHLPLERAAAFVAFAASEGYAFTIDELKVYVKRKHAAATGRILTETELDAMAGDYYFIFDSGCMIYEFIDSPHLWPSHLLLGSWTKR
jgi:hypothetical protein